MPSSSDERGPRGNSTGPAPVLDPDELRKLRRRLDRIYGTALFIIGIALTVSSMTALTEQGIVTQMAAMFEQYGAGDYTRPDGLAPIALAGVLLHPLNYALWLYLALRRWRAGKAAAWCAIVGGLIGWLITVAVLSVAASMHPALVDAVVATLRG